MYQAGVVMFFISYVGVKDGVSQPILETASTNKWLM
jgi:hypothetical protein